MGLTYNDIESAPTSLIDNLLLLQNEIDIKREEENKKLNRKNGRT